jgi:hypothetical protein
VSVVLMSSCGAILLVAAGCGIESDAAGFDQSGETSEPQEFLLAPARGLSIVEVEINQGTRIPIGVGGDWIDEDERLGHLISSRDSLLRIHYVVEEGWVPREIEARLTLDFPDGSSKSFTDLRIIESDSAPEDFNGPFYFGLVADEGHTIFGTRYAIELWETQAGGEDLPEGAWANPAAGPQPIGFEAEPMQIKSLLVPITYQGTTANLDEATTQLLIDNLYEQNPTAQIVYDVHDPVAYDSQLIDLANLLPVMAALRSSENAEPNVYYHALVDVGSSSIAGLHGISSIANDTQGDAGSRVSATVLWSPNPSFAADTYTHETGHAQGLAHVECPNQSAAEADGTYPHVDGHIGNWGFAIRRFLMFDPDDAYDYMSYCGPSWVSDWTWNKTYERIRTLTAWDFEAGEGAGARERTDEQPLEQLLVVAVSADGSRQWWTMPGTMDPERVDGHDRIEFESWSGEVIEVYADVATLSDGRTRWIKAALPNRLDMTELAAIRHVRAGEVASVTTAAVGIDIDLERARAWQPEWKIYQPR